MGCERVAASEEQANGDRPCSPRRKRQPIIAVDADQTDAQPQSDILESLEAAAQRGDERAFIAACQRRRLANTVAEAHVRAINLALSAGAHLAARNLALQGAKRFPGSSRDRKIRLRACAAKGRKKYITHSIHPSTANRDWLATYGDSYRGQWVGLKNGQPPRFPLHSLAAWPNRSATQWCVIDKGILMLLRFTDGTPFALGSAPYTYGPATAAETPHVSSSPSLSGRSKPRHW